MIVARSHEDAKSFARANNLLPQNWSYITHFEQIIGMERFIVLALNGWDEKNRMIEQYIRSRREFIWINIREW